MYNVLNATEYWNFYPTSELTGVGMRQHYLIGRQFRKTYIEELKLLSNNFNASEVIIQTTDSERTQMSAQAQMYGLFYKKAEQMPSHWKFQQSTDLPPFNIDNHITRMREIDQFNLPHQYQPIPIHGPVKENDSVMVPYDVCPKIRQLKKQAYNSQTVANFMKYLQQNNFLQRFRQLFDIPKDQEITIYLIGKYFDTLNCNYYQQIPFPIQMTENDWEWIQFVYHFQQLYINYGNFEAKQLQVSNFLINLLDHIDGAIYNNSGKKFAFYSGSDGNLNVLNVIFNVVTYTTSFSEWKQNKTKYSNTPFASTILLEIQQKNDQFFVLYKYNGITYNICGNQPECLYEDFKKECNKWIINYNEFLQNCN